MASRHSSDDVGWNILNALGFGIPGMVEAVEDRVEKRSKGEPVDLDDPAWNAANLFTGGMLGAMEWLDRHSK